MQGYLDRYDPFNTGVILEARVDMDVSFRATSSKASLLWIPVEFQIDTGAQITGIAEQQAARVLPQAIIDALPLAGSYTAAGEQQTKKALVEFRTRDPELVIGPLAVQLHTYHVEGIPIPSLLGRDVLQHFRLTLDWKREPHVLLEPH